MSLPQRLNLIVSYAAEILDAEACGIWLKQHKVLTLAADYGFAGTAVAIGHQITIHDEAKGGLTGYIAHTGKLFNAYGEALKNHDSVSGQLSSQTGSGACYSLLAVPICRRSGQNKKVVGLLRMENKRDEGGGTGPHLKFTVADETTLQIFAEAVAVALESADLVNHLQEKKEHFSRLIASSPIGVVANGRDGIVTDFNQRAQEILGYAPKEILGNPVEILYANPQEAMLVGKKLYESPQGRVTDYETAVTSRDGTFIPIRLSATLLHDAQGEHIGTVGYFEDFRLIREARGRLELILAANKLLASASDLRGGLQRLAEMMVQHWGVAFARVFLLTEDGETLKLQASYPLSGQIGEWRWQPQVGMVTAVADWPDLHRSLAERDYFVLNASDGRHQSILARWGELVALSQEIQSLLVVPLRTRDKIVGLIDFGEVAAVGEMRFAEDLGRI
jgi:PAS domain S-box-containing protein